MAVLLPSLKPEFRDSVTPTRSRASSCISTHSLDVVEISSDTEDDIPTYSRQVSYRKRKRISSDAQAEPKVKVEANLVVEVYGSDSEPSPPKQPKKKKRRGNDTIRVTRQERVKSVETITAIPSSWTIPRTSTAFLLDLSEDNRILTKSNGNRHSMTSFIRHEVHSYDGIFQADLTLSLSRITTPGEAPGGVLKEMLQFISYLVKTRLDVVVQILHVMARSCASSLT